MRAILLWALALAMFGTTVYVQRMYNGQKTLTPIATYHGKCDSKKSLSKVDGKEYLTYTVTCTNKDMDGIERETTMIFGESPLRKPSGAASE